MSTEGRNPRSLELDSLSAHEIVQLMNAEEAAVLEAVNGASESIALAAEKAAEAYRVGGRVLYVGSGTSGRIAAMDAAEMPPTFGISADRLLAIIAGGAEALTRSIEGAEDDPSAGMAAVSNLSVAPPDVVFGIAASGRTPFVIGAVREARTRGCWTGAIVNNRASRLADEAAHEILLDTGPEVLTGSTRLKAGTAQKLVLNRISTIAMVLNDKVISNLMVDVSPTNSKLRERCVRMVCTLTGAPEHEARTSLEQNGYCVRTAVNLLMK